MSSPIQQNWSWNGAWQFSRVKCSLDSLYNLFDRVIQWEAQISNHLPNITRIVQLNIKLSTRILIKEQKKMKMYFIKFSLKRWIEIKRNVYDSIKCFFENWINNFINCQLNMKIGLNLKYSMLLRNIFQHIYAWYKNNNFVYFYQITTSR